jgi:hypothetical protein
MEHARLCRIVFRVFSGSSSLIVLWYHRILTAHHARFPGNFWGLTGLNGNDLLLVVLK